VGRQGRLREAWRSRRQGRTIGTFLESCLLAAAVLGLVSTSLPLQGQTPQSLSQVKTLCIESFGEGKVAGALREALIKRLRKAGVYQLVEDPGGAEALLKGSGEIWIRGYTTTNWRAPATNRQPVYAGYLSVEVVGRNGKPIWSYLVTPDKLIWTSITDDLAGSMVKAMIAASQQSATINSPGPNNASIPTTLHGAGATFPAPLYQKWFQLFQQVNTKIRLQYEAVGSEKGLEMLADGQVDFAASDASSPDVGDSKLTTDYWRIPMILGAVVPIYNLPDLGQDLRFTPKILAGIYLGRIKNWDDPEIRKWNRGASLPRNEIVVIHRTDGSGTTYTWGDYLSKVSPEWKAALGTGFRINWPIGIGADGNQGVASAVQKTPYSIGYVELVYAIRQRLDYGAVQNRSGVFVRASLSSVAEAATQSAASNVQLPSSITNSPGKASYPIATFTWIVFRQHIGDITKGTALLDLLRWMLTDGQKQCSALAYTPLPNDLVDRELELVRSLK